jgi:hypothetical protein
VVERGWCFAAVMCVQRTEQSGVLFSFDLQERRLGFEERQRMRGTKNKIINGKKRIKRYFLGGTK